MTEEAAIETAGRLLLRYGWKPSADDMKRLVGTERQSMHNRIMNDPDAQRRAVKELAERDENAADELVALCATRRHFDASARARFLVDRNGAA